MTTHHPWGERWRRCPKCNGMSEILVTDGATLRATRKRAGLSLRALGERIGVSAAYLCDVEKGARNGTKRVLDGYKKIGGMR